MKQLIRSIGNVKWNNEEIKKSIPEFLELYKKKPIENNQGGMEIPHMFSTWFMLKKISPTTVVESGIFKGQGTWLIENALPNAKIYSIDLNLSNIDYKSPNVTYFDIDFSSIDWSLIDDKENTVLFFDDHQNALQRIKQGRDLGFSQFIFEDNYPAQVGDCYSLKKVFQKAGFVLDEYRRKNCIEKLFSSKYAIKSNQADVDYLVQNLDVYHEFPPILKSKKTRWGDEWDENYPTPPSVYEKKEHVYLELFEKEAQYYTWICYAKLKKIQ